MTENIEVLNEKHQALERRHSEVVKENDLRYNTILSTLNGMREILAAIDTKIAVSQIDLHHTKTDIESDRIKIKDLKKEVGDISSAVLKLEKACDSMTSRDPVTLWTSISAAVTAVGSFIYVLIHGIPKP